MIFVKKREFCFYLVMGAVMFVHGAYGASLENELAMLKNNLTALKGQLAKLSKSLNELKDKLQGGAEVLPVKVDPNTLPVALQAYPDAAIAHDNTMKAKITSFGGMQAAPSGSKIYVTFVIGDIAPQQFEDGNRSAIVNAAASAMRGGGGMDTAIHNAAGVLLEYEQHCNLDCPTGEARITPSFNIGKTQPGVTARWIVHCVGPVGEKPVELSNTYQNALRVAWLNGLDAICFCAVSTAIFGYNIKNATPVALKAVLDFLKTNKPKIKEVRFFIFKMKSTQGPYPYTPQEAYEIYQKSLDKLASDPNNCLIKLINPPQAILDRLNASTAVTIPYGVTHEPLVYEFTVP
jgi:O-acetyl-ADP-ribose deacetylase (regulator of RNase III)